MARAHTAGHRTASPSQYEDSGPYVPAKRLTQREARHEDIDAARTLRVNVLATALSLKAGEAATLNRITYRNVIYRVLAT